MKVYLLSILSILAFSAGGFSQSVGPQVVNSSGGSSQSGNYFLEWNVGELALVNQMQSPDGKYIITNGLLQPFADFAPDANGNGRFNDDEITILPNPTKDVIEVLFKTKMAGKVSMRLYAVNGELLNTTEFQSYGYGYTQKVSLNKYPGGTYFLYILLRPVQGRGKLGTFKIVKLQ